MVAANRSNDPRDTTLQPTVSWKVAADLMVAIVTSDTQECFTSQLPLYESSAKSSASHYQIQCTKKGQVANYQHMF